MEVVTSFKSDRVYIIKMHSIEFIKPTTGPGPEWSHEAMQVAQRLGMHVFKCSWRLCVYPGIQYPVVFNVIKELFLCRFRVRCLSILRHRRDEPAGPARPCAATPWRFDWMLYLGVSDMDPVQLKILQALTRKFQLDLTHVAGDCLFNITSADFYALLEAMLRTGQEIDARTNRRSAEMAHYAEIRERFSRSNVNNGNDAADSEASVQGLYNKGKSKDKSVGERGLESSVVREANAVEDLFKAVIYHRVKRSGRPELHGRPTYWQAAKLINMTKCGMKEVNTLVGDPAVDHHFKVEFEMPRVFGCRS
ncbi:hypothetical protein BJY52DRAFT_1416952 [Lactarius psammicola]|nr:hypothetical protein BJY52DRAFT_1416952 [Lactarius psammicola]